MHAVVEKKMYLTIGEVTFEVSRKFLGDPPDDAMHFNVGMTCPASYARSDRGDVVWPDEYDEDMFVELTLWPEKKHCDNDQINEINKYMIGHLFFGGYGGGRLHRHILDYEEGIESRVKQEMAEKRAAKCAKAAARRAEKAQLATAS